METNFIDHRNDAEEIIISTKKALTSRLAVMEKEAKTHYEIE